MTDSNKPNRPSRRKDASREPPTIDLKATEVNEPAPREDAPPPGSDPKEESTETTPAAATPDATRADEPPAAETPPGMDAGQPDAGAAQPGAPVREPRRSPGIGALLGVGLVGGLVGAGAVLAVETWRGEPGQADPRVAQLQQEVGGLAPAEAVTGLAERLTALQQAQSAIVERVQAAQQLAERGAAQAEEALGRPIPESPVPAVTENRQALADLQNRVAALETQLQDRIQAVTNDVAGLERQLAQTTESLRGAIAESTDAVRRLVSEQEQRLAALDRQVAEGGSAATRAGTRVVLAERLTDALSEGVPYVEILSALSAFDTDPSRLNALEPFAQEGAPTAAALTRSFEPLGDRIMRESRPAGSWSDRLMRMADRVVTVRPVDEPGSTDPSSLVARIEAALSEGDFGRALAAWEALPEPARSLSDEWGQVLRRRAAAEAAARAIAANAVAALNSATR